LKESGLVQNVREINGGTLGGAEDLSLENSMQASLIGRFERIQGFRDSRANSCLTYLTYCIAMMLIAWEQPYSLCRHQGQPYFAGSNFTSVSTFRNLQRQPSSPLDHCFELTNQRCPANEQARSQKVPTQLARSSKHTSPITAGHALFHGCVALRIDVCS
jgi:hypothetical protein